MDSISISDKKAKTFEEIFKEYYPTLVRFLAYSSNHNIRPARGNKCVVPFYPDASIYFDYIKNINLDVFPHTIPNDFLGIRGHKHPDESEFKKLDDRTGDIIFDRQEYTNETQRRNLAREAFCNRQNTEQVDRRNEVAAEYIGSDFKSRIGNMLDILFDDKVDYNQRYEIAQVINNILDLNDEQAITKKQSRRVFNKKLISGIQHSGKYQPDDFDQFISDMLNTDYSGLNECNINLVKACNQQASSSLADEIMELWHKDTDRKLAGIFIKNLDSTKVYKDASGLYLSLLNAGMYDRNSRLEYSVSQRQASAAHTLVAEAPQWIDSIILGLEDAIADPEIDFQATHGHEKGVALSLDDREEIIKQLRSLKADIKDALKHRKGDQEEVETTPDMDELQDDTPPFADQSTYKPVLAGYKFFDGDYLEIERKFLICKKKFKGQLNYLPPNHPVRQESENTIQEMHNFARGLPQLLRALLYLELFDFPPANQFSIETVKNICGNQFNMFDFPPESRVSKEEMRAIYGMTLWKLVLSDKDLSHEKDMLCISCIPEDDVNNHSDSLWKDKPWTKRYMELLRYRANKNDNLSELLSFHAAHFGFTGHFGGEYLATLPKYHGDVSLYHKNASQFMEFAESVETWLLYLCRLAKRNEELPHYKGYKWKEIIQGDVLPDDYDVDTGEVFDKTKVVKSIQFIDKNLGKLFEESAASNIKTLLIGNPGIYSVPSREFGIITRSMQENAFYRFLSLPGMHEVHPPQSREARGVGRMKTDAYYAEEGAHPAIFAGKKIDVALVKRQDVGSPLRVKNGIIIPSNQTYTPVAVGIDLHSPIPRYQDERIKAVQNRGGLFDDQKRSKENAVTKVGNGALTTGININTTLIYEDYEKLLDDVTGKYKDLPLEPKFISEHRAYREALAVSLEDAWKYLKRNNIEYGHVLPEYRLLSVVIPDVKYHEAGKAKEAVDSIKSDIRREYLQFQKSMVDMIYNITNGYSSHHGSQQIANIMAMKTADNVLNFPPPAPWKQNAFSLTQEQLNQRY